MKLKALGLAAIAAMAFTAFAASSASATTLEVGGIQQAGAVAISASLEPGTSTLWSRTDGTLINTCTTSNVQGTTSVLTGSTVTGPLSTLTFANCIRTVTVDQRGQLYVQHESGTTNGTVFSENTTVRVGSAFGHIHCTTSEGTDIGTLTGATTTSNSSAHATIHINAVLHCGWLAPSVLWRGSYTVTSPTDLGVTA